MGRGKGWLVVGWMVAASIALAGCSGVRPIKKGDTVRCPSCGAEFKIEEGMGHDK